MQKNNYFDFTGKTALITGASGSIGANISETLNKFGAHVIITGTNKERLAKTAHNLNKDHTIKICDIKNQDECTKLVSELEKIDILVCNAGITEDKLSIAMSNQTFENVISVNLTSNFILCREAIKKMMKIGEGRIINISSVVGVIGNPGQSNYCASKAGLIGMTKSLAHEVASRNITVNAIAPGFIKSNMTEKLNETIKEKIYTKIPMAKFGEPSDIAHAVIFLASQNANYITGQTIHVNGGMAMI